MKKSDFLFNELTNDFIQKRYAVYSYKGMYLQLFSILQKIYFHSDINPTLTYTHRNHFAFMYLINMYLTCIKSNQTFSLSTRIYSASPYLDKHREMKLKVWVKIQHEFQKELFQNTYYTTQFKITFCFFRCYKFPNL